MFKIWFYLCNTVITKAYSKVGSTGILYYNLKIKFYEFKKIIQLNLKLCTAKATVFTMTSKTKHAFLID